MAESHLRQHGLDPATELIVVRPRDGEATVRATDLAAAIHDARDRLAVALLAGVNYATGQVLDIAALTGAVHEAGGLALWDLAHAAGNVALALHDQRRGCGGVVHLQVPQWRTRRGGASCSSTSAITRRRPPRR